jgi:hypothetical protein
MCPSDRAVQRVQEDHIDGDGHNDARWRRRLPVTDTGAATCHPGPVPCHILDVTRGRGREHRPFFEPMTGSLGNHLIHRQPTTGFGQ